MAATILLVEDDETFCYLIGERLQEEGFEVVVAHDGAMGLHALERHRPDLVLLDVLMPIMDGWETCRLMREVSDVPIIMLTCRTSQGDIVRGLEIGADDYVTKPFDTPELLARIQAALRRRKYLITEQERVEIDDRLVLDRSRCQVLMDGQVVDLSATEFKLLACFVDNANRILTHRSLLTQVWGWEYADEKDYVKVYVSRLRAKIEPDPDRPRYILTERGLGYRFQVPGDL
jgi:two-component system KDP operon response regulator KdpE